MSVTLGVSFTITGVRATSFTHWVIMVAYSGTWPTAAPMPRSDMPCGHPKFSSSRSAPESSVRRTISCQDACFDSTISEATTVCLGKRFRSEHAMRASEVQLQQVGARIFCAANNLVPGCLLRFHHQRSDHRVLGKAFLHIGDLAQVVFNGAIADEFDVVQPHHAFIFQINRAIARGGVDDGFANGLPYGPAPSGIKGPHNLVGGVGRRPGSQPERIRGMHSAEIDA